VRRRCLQLQQIARDSEGRLERHETMIYCVCHRDDVDLYAGFFFVIPFYLQSVPVHSANCVKKRIQLHVEEYSLALLCN
jgi:hypothetical protein